MSTLDEAKERLRLLKFWLGVIVGSCLANIGWLATNYKQADILILVGSIVVIFGLIISFFIVNKKIEKKLKNIGDLK